MSLAPAVIPAPVVTGRPVSASQFTVKESSSQGSPLLELELLLEELLLEELGALLELLGLALLLGLGLLELLWLELLLGLEPLELLGLEPALELLLEPLLEVPLLELDELLGLLALLLEGPLLEELRSRYLRSN